MLHHDQRVTNVPQPFQGGDEPLVIPLMQPNRRFVEHIKHPRQARADLSGEPNPLRLPTRQGPGRPVERQIGEPHINQKLQPGLNFLQHRPGNELFARP